MEFSDIFGKVLAKVKPKTDILEQINPILTLIQSSADDLNIKAKVQAGGSTAKNTYLATNHDCDVFVKFDLTTYKNEDISALLEKILTNTTYDFTQVHGSRDYFQATIEDIEFEIIPVLDVSDPKDALNVTDMSPLHVKWVIDRTKDNNITDHIRLAKQFCKAQKVYGAESYIGGFSGHIIDILVIYYGGFIELLQATKNWHDGDLIDPMNFYKNKNSIDHMNESKIDSPLIIIDPILPERNAASALTKKRWEAFKLAANEFLAKPAYAFFEEKPLTKDFFEGDVFEVVAEPLDGKKDIVGAKCKKAFEYVLQQTKEYGFEIEQADWEFASSNTKMYFVPKNTQLSEKDIIKGPPLKMESACEAFRIDKQKTFEKDGFLYAEENREFTDFETMLQKIILDDYFLERVESARLSK